MFKYECLGLSNGHFKHFFLFLFLFLFPFHFFFQRRLPPSCCTSGPGHSFWRGRPLGARKERNRKCLDVTNMILTLQSSPRLRGTTQTLSLHFSPLWQLALHASPASQFLEKPSRYHDINMKPTMDQAYLAAISSSDSSGVFLHAELVSIPSLKLGALKSPTTSVEFQVRHLRDKADGILASLTFSIHGKRQSQDQYRVQWQHFESIQTRDCTTPNIQNHLYLLPLMKICFPVWS